MGAALGLAIRALILSLGTLFSGWKLFFGALITTILGVVLYNLIADILEEGLAFVTASIDGVTGQLPSLSLQFVGLGAWLAHAVQLEDQIALAVTFIGLKWLVVKIPFVKW